MSIIFAGTPEFAKIHLQALIDKKVDICAVYTQPDRPKGRGQKVQISPVKELAQAHGIEVLTPCNFKDPNDVEKFKSFNAKLAVVVAYGLLLPQSILDAPEQGCINVHGSLLPKLRGAAPIQRAIINGDSHTGICIMKMTKQLDSGDVLIKEQIPIDSDDNQETLFNKLAHLGAKVLADNIDLLINGKIKGVAQDENEVTFAPKLLKEQGQINFNNTAKAVNCHIRGFTPSPGAFICIDDLNYKVFASKILNTKANAPAGSIVDITKEGIIIACQDYNIALQVMQKPGKSKVSAYDLARNNPQVFHMGASIVYKEQA